MKVFTEIQNYVRRFSSVSPEKNITVLDGDGGTEIYSIGEDGALYLTYENDGNASKFSRLKLLKNAQVFAAAKIPVTGKTAVAAADADTVVLAVAQDAKTLTDEDFNEISLDGMLGGKKLKPSNLLICALKKGITLFVEMKDEGGRIEQFACLLDSANPRAVQYFPLASNFSSVVCSAAGRAVGQYVDGIYTCGEYGSTKQLLYTPSCNVFGTSQPAPLRLKNDFNVETIGTLPLSDGKGTHLFAVGEGGLYFYPWERQIDLYHTDRPDPDFAVSSELFNEAKKVAPVVFDDKLYVYVLNESNLLSYTYADYSGGKPSRFVEPVRFMEGVFYFDISSGGVMNICTADKAVFGVRDPITGNWGFTEAHIGTDLDESRSMSAYVTKITELEPGEEITLRARGEKKASCYINGIYHKFLKLSARADAAGSISIIQPACDLNPDCFEAGNGSEEVQINPAAYARDQVLALTDPGKVKSQVITAPDGTTSRLFENVDENGVAMAASGISSLGNAANCLIPGFVPSPVGQFAKGVVVKITEKIVSVLPYDVTHNPFVSFLSELVHDVEYAFNWVKDKVKWLYDHTIGPVVDFVIAKINDAWKFVVKIGEKILEVAIETIGGVFGAVKKLLELIGIPVDKIFDWLKKALNLDEVDRVNDVMKKMIKLSGHKLAEQASVLKDDVLDKLQEVIGSVEKWADIGEGQVREAVGSAVNRKLCDTGFALTPHNTYMIDTLLGGFNFNDIVMPHFAVPEALNSVLASLEQTIRDQAAGMGEAADIVMSIGDNIQAILKTGDVTELCVQMKQILAKAAVAGLTLCRSFIGLIFDAVILAADAVTDLLTSPIQIPFISQVLKLFGVNEFCIVDLITYPAAFLLTNITIAATGQPVFSKQAYDTIMDAQTLDQVSAAF